MATETRTTTEREDAPIGAGDAVSDARDLGRLEGQVSILLLNVEDLRRQSREYYRALDAKIDANFDSMNALIDSVNARIDRNFYWMLGLFGAIIVTVIGSAIWLGN